MLTRAIGRKKRRSEGNAPRSARAWPTATGTRHEAITRSTRRRRLRRRAGFRSLYFVPGWSAARPPLTPHPPLGEDAERGRGRAALKAKWEWPPALIRPRPAAASFRPPHAPTRAQDRAGTARAPKTAPTPRRLPMSGPLLPGYLRVVAGANTGPPATPHERSSAARLPAGRRRGTGAEDGAPDAAAKLSLPPPRSRKSAQQEKRGAGGHALRRLWDAPLDLRQAHRQRCPLKR